MFCRRHRDTNQLLKKRGPCVSLSEVAVDTYYSTDIIIVVVVVVQAPPPWWEGPRGGLLGGKSLSLYPEGKGQDAEGPRVRLPPPLFSLPFCLSILPSIPPPPLSICGASSPCRGGSSLRPLPCPAFWWPPSGSSGRRTARRRWRGPRSRGWACWSGWGSPGRRAPDTGWVGCRPAGSGPGTWGPRTPYRPPWGEGEWRRSLLVGVLVMVRFILRGPRQKGPGGPYKNLAES